MEKIRRGMQGMSDTVLRGRSVMSTKVRKELCHRRADGWDGWMGGMGGPCHLPLCALMRVLVDGWMGARTPARSQTTPNKQMNHVGALEITTVRDFLTTAMNAFYALSGQGPADPLAGAAGGAAGMFVCGRV